MTSTHGHRNTQQPSGMPHQRYRPFPPIDLPDWDTRVPGLPALNDPEGDRPRGSITNDHGY